MVPKRFYVRFLLLMYFVCFLVASWLIYSGAPSLAGNLDSNSTVNPQSEIRNSLKGALINAAEVNSAHLKQWKKEGLNAVVLLLSEKELARQIYSAAQHIRRSGLNFYYWIEIARHPVMADEHPEWMASLQGHQEWRRHFPTFPETAEGEVVKNYPWVPILYQEAFNAHLKRVSALINDLPAPQGVFLNDLQAAPSACGCGNRLCRWTPDYGPIKTATRLPADAAARFAGAVGKLIPQSRIIPVWTTECEEPDGAKDGACAGVGCFSGLCWKEYTTQLMPVANEFQTLGVLLPYRDFERDLLRYGSAAGWVKHALDSFVEMPPKRHGQAVSVGRLIAVLQGWDVTQEQRIHQIQQCEKAGAAGYVLALTKIEQGWEPRIVKPQAHE